MKLECDDPLSNVAFKFNLRRCNEDTREAAAAAAGVRRRSERRRGLLHDEEEEVRGARERRSDPPLRERRRGLRRRGLLDDADDGGGDAGDGDEDEGGDGAGAGAGAGAGSGGAGVTPGRISPSILAAVSRGRAVQVDPMKPKLKPPGTERLKLKCDTVLSSFAFKFDLRRYTAAKTSGTSPTGTPRGNSSRATRRSDCVR